MTTRSNLNPSTSSGFSAPDPRPPLSGFLLGLGAEGCVAIESLLWRPLERLRYLICTDSTAMAIRRLPSGNTDGERTEISTLANDILGSFVFGHRQSREAAEILQAQPELLQPALTLGIGLNLGVESSHPLRGLVDMPIILPATDDSALLHRQLYWLVHDLYAVFFTPALVCVDIVDVLVAVDKCERVFFACATGTDPFAATEHALRHLESQGLCPDQAQGLLGVISSDEKIDLQTYHSSTGLIKSWLPKTAIGAYTVRGYPKGLEGLFRVSLYGAKRG